MGGLQPAGLQGGLDKQPEQHLLGSMWESANRQWHWAHISERARSNGHGTKDCHGCLHEGLCESVFSAAMPLSPGHTCLKNTEVWLHKPALRQPG